MISALLVLLLHGSGYTVRTAGPNGPYLAITDTGARTITLYVHPGEPSSLQRKVLAYEIGHVVDVECLTDRQRRRWLHLRHSNATWYPPTLEPEQSFGSGDFADVFSDWATRSRSYFASQVRHAPAPRDLASLARRFHFAAGACGASR